MRGDRDFRIEDGCLWLAATAAAIGIVTSIVGLVLSHRSAGRFTGFVLSGLIFAAVGAGFQMWEASHRSSRPSKATIVATPDGGRVMDRREHAPESAGLVKTVSASGSITATGGFLYGACFGAMLGTKSRGEVVRCTMKKSSKRRALSRAGQALEKQGTAWPVVGRSKARTVSDVSEVFRLRFRGFPSEGDNWSWSKP